MNKSKITSIVKSKDGAFFLYCAGFMMSLSISIWWVGLPFILKRLGGTDADVGICFATGMMFYAFGCIIGGKVLQDLNPRSVARAGACSNAVMMLAIFAVVFLDQREVGLFSPIWLVIICQSLCGLSISFFWPFLMGWLSTGHEGPSLNRRLGKHNISWSSASLIGALVGGWLVEHNSIGPLLASAGASILCFGVLGLGSNLKGLNVSDPTKQIQSDDLDPKHLRFRYMTMAGLLISFVCVGLVRSQLGLLLKFELDYSESFFGTLMMVLSLSNFVTMAAMGKTQYWHYRFNIYAVAIVALILSMVMIIYGNGLLFFVLAVFVLGCGNAVMYSSHLYYGVTGAKMRSSRMAIHETVLSTGFFIGSLVGGYLSNNLGPYTPYWFGLTVIAAGLLGHAIIWPLTKRK